MDRRFITVLGVSLLFALVVTTIFYQAVNKGSAAPAKASATSTDMKDVVVATKALQMGTTIKTGDVKTVKMPVEQFPKGAFGKVEEVLDRPIVSNILAEEPVLEPRLAQRGAGYGITPAIPPGMRAVAVRVTDDSAVAGFVLPGVRVDVLITGRPPSGMDTVTKTILQNILVLSAGTTIQPDQRGQAVQAPTVTLLVTLEQAEVLTLAGSEGRIKLVLRNGADQDEQSTIGTNMNSLYRSAGGRPTRSLLGGSNLTGNSGIDEDNERPRPAPRRRVAAAAPPPVVAPPPSLPPVQAPPDQILVIRGSEKKLEVVRPASPDAPVGVVAPAPPPQQ